MFKNLKLSKKTKENKLFLFLWIFVSTVLLWIFMINALPQTFAASGDSYTLVTSTSELAVGDQVIIVASNSNFAMSTLQNGNNRGQITITKNGTGIGRISNLQVLTLVAGSTGGTFGLNAVDGTPWYLYAASSSSNYLRTKTTMDLNSSREIKITGGNTSIVSKWQYTRNIMQHNVGSSLFACYSSASQAPLSIYKLITDTPPIATIDLAAGQTALTTSLTNKFLVSFSKPIDTSTFACDDITFAWTAVGTCTNIQQISPNNGTTFEITSTANNDGIMSIDIEDGKIADTVWTLNWTTIISNNTITIDTTEPITTISLADGQDSSTTSLTGKFLVTFSEPINTSTFTCDDVDVSGTTDWICTSINQTTPNDGTTFEVTLLASDTGTIVINIEDNKITDIAGNRNWATTIHNNTITITAIVTEFVWTQLYPWDIFIVTVNTNPDFFEFLVRKNLESGTVIYFTDNAWDSDKTRKSNEGSISFTASENIQAGTTLSVVWTQWATPSLMQTTLGTIIKNGSFDLAGGGDQILVYQWISYNDPNPSRIYGIGLAVWTSRIIDWVPSTHTSYLPSGLNKWTSAFEHTITSHKSIQYNWTNTDFWNENFVSDFHNIANWTWNTAGNYFWPIDWSIDENPIITYILMYDTDANGTISGEAIQEINQWENWTPVEAIANTGYHFVQRSDGITTNPRIDVNINSDIDVTAQFDEDIIYILVYDTDSNGTISGTDWQEISEWWNWTPVEAVANPGYHFIHRSDGRSDNPRTDLNVSSEIEVTAYFVQDAAITYTLEYIAWSNGTISWTSSQTIEENTDGYLVEAIANPGYHFTQRNDGITTNPRTDTNITWNISVTAQFDANPITSYTLSYSTDSNGSLNGTTSQTIIEWEDWTPVEAIANNGYHFTQRSDGKTDNPRIDSNVNWNISVTAQFDEDVIPNNPTHWWGGVTFPMDYCPDGDNSPSYYDWICEAENIHWSADIEKWKNVFYPQINRAQLGKFIWKLTNNILKLKTTNDINCKFEDIKDIDEEWQKYIIYSCKYGIMWVNWDGLTSKEHFEPNQTVTYNEFATVISRLLYWVKYNYEQNRYEKHVEQIEKIWLLKQWDVIKLDFVGRIFGKIYKNQDMIER